jgi:acyl carrier protein
MTESIARAVKQFVVTNFLFGQDAAGLTDTQSFLETGIVDSTGVLELVGFLEQNFAITVEDGELLPDNLDSIQNITQFVSRKLAAQGARVAG